MASKMIAIGPNGQPVAAPAVSAPAPAVSAPAPAVSAPAPGSVSWHKTKGGIWCIVGPAEIIQAGAEVTVTTKAGKVQSVKVATVGRDFVRDDGTSYRYGYR